MRVCELTLVIGKAKNGWTVTQEHPTKPQTDFVAESEDKARALVTNIFENWKNDSFAELQENDDA